MSSEWPVVDGPAACMTTTVKTDCVFVHAAKPHPTPTKEVLGT